LVHCQRHDALHDNALHGRKALLCAWGGRGAEQSAALKLAVFYEMIAGFGLHSGSLLPSAGSAREAC